MPRIITYSQFTRPLLRSYTSTSRSISTIVTTNIIRSRTQNLRTSNYPKYSSKMSFSNANTGDKPSDPYKKNNADDASIKEKIEDLSEFISACKFGMMTTRDGQSGALVSRCMALAGKVFILVYLPYKCVWLTFLSGKCRHRSHLPYKYRVWQDKRYRFRLSHQHLLPQLLRRMGIHLRQGCYHYRYFCR